MEVNILNPSAGKWALPGPWLTCTGAERGYTAGVAVAVSNRYTYHTAHGQMSFLIYGQRDKRKLVLLGG